MEEADVTLRDGTTAHLRPARPDDRARVEALYEQLTEHSRRMRFHRPIHELPEELLAGVVTPDYQREIVVLAEHEGRVVGLGGYHRHEDQVDHADIAFTVEEAHQGLGVATQLLYLLAAVARDHGITVFEADVLEENESMLKVFRGAGLDMTSTLKFGTYHISFPVPSR